MRLYALYHIRYWHNNCDYVLYSAQCTEKNAFFCSSFVWLFGGSAECISESSAVLEQKKNSYQQQKCTRAVEISTCNYNLTTFLFLLSCTRLSFSHSLTNTHWDALSCAPLDYLHNERFHAQPQNDNSRFCICCIFSFHQCQNSSRNG